MKDDEHRTDIPAPRHTHTTKSDLTDQRRSQPPPTRGSGKIEGRLIGTWPDVAGLRRVVAGQTARAAQVSAKPQQLYPYPTIWRFSPEPPAGNAGQQTERSRIGTSGVRRTQRGNYRGVGSPSESHSTALLCDRRQ